MAVYKSTRCYPFLNNVDIRVTQALDSNEQPVQYLKCKVDTSNKQVTGYKIRILDEANNQVFPLKGRDYISPISELQIGNMEDIYERNGINSGLNGTYLYIPFFQNLKANKTYSFNALYYTPQYRVDHIVLDNALYSLFKGAPSTISGANNLDNWQEDIGEDYYWLKYNWPPTSVEDHISNNIQLDGETLLEGQKVLVAAAGATSIRRGIYTVTKAQAVVDGQSIIQTVLQFSNYITNTQALVTHGEMFHNTVWSRSNYIAEDSGLFQELTPYTSTPSDGYVTVPNMRVSNSFYKWEITLYQGEGIVVGDSYGKYITYDSLEYQDYDMTVASGTILGSTSSRIQIASTTPFGEIAPVLPGLKQGVLVLQGKYMALGANGDNDILSNNRFYVKSYDASFGHAYTLDGALDASNVQQYTKAQFFKYSNDPDSILETDKVLYGFGGNIDFIFCDISTTPPTVKNSFDEFSRVGVNNRRYGIAKSDLPLILAQNIQFGDIILLTGQIGGTPCSSACQNGVYRVYDPGISGLSSGTLWLKRASSYDTWSNFLGKVIYCVNYYATQTTGVAKSVNLESLAGSGSYTLWDPDQAGADQTKGGGNLYFSNEKPILLFGQNFNSDYTYDLKSNSSIDDGQPVASFGGAIDGIPVQEGFTVVCKQGATQNVSVVVVQNIGGTLYFKTVDGSSIKIPNNNQMYYITQGKQYGKKMFKGVSTTPDWSLYTATVLHNTTGYTFITPALNVEKTMCLKLTQNKSITLSNDTITSWLKISDVDKTVHCVKHLVLKTPFVSEISIDNNTPYKYEVRSYFKASDENPFSVCEAPYLVLYKNNQEYSTLRNSSLYQEYWTTVELDILQQFNVTPSAGDTQVYLFKSYTDSAAVLDRAVKFSAKYTQFDGLSWESYRWTLFNANGVLLQDSGVKYDKSIAAVFYGLSNDSVQNSNYYVVLEVEDEKKNQLIYLIKVEVEIGSVATSASNFTAKFDCDNHAVRLDYIPWGTGSNSNKATIYRREYEVYERPGLKIFGRAEELSEGKLYFTIPTPDGYKVADCKPNIIYVDERTDYYYELDETQKPIEIQVDDKKVMYKFIKMVDAVRIYKGEWSLVALKTELKTLYDYNVTSGKRYQYLLYPNDTMSFDIDEGVYLANSNEQIFANSDESYNVWEEDAEFPNQGRIVSGSTALSTTTGAPVVTQWDEWSICELIPDTNIEDTPSIKKAYKVNKDQVWLFKYSLETGSQNQNISRKDIQTLGTYVKMGFGNLNYASGEVTALLGSELVLGTDAKYIERLKKSRVEALSTNEKVKMLAAWRDFVYSKNPKLLKDIKGQSWIVQIVSSSNNPKNFYTNQPDTITFQWKQIDDTFNTIIYSDAGQLQTEMQAYGSELWEPKFKFGSTPNDRFIIVWQNWDGSRFYDEVVEYNQIPTVPTNTPTREATAEYTYTFTKWEPELTKATENKIYTAQYSKTRRTYTVTWQWDGGGLVQTYSYGEYPQYTGDEPSTSEPGYEFTGWTPDVDIVTQDVIYTATFQKALQVQFLSQNGTWYEDLQEWSGLEPAPITQPITGVEYGESIWYTNEDTRVPGHEEYEGCLIYYNHAEYGRIQGRFYFVPDEDTEDFTYDSGHVQGPDYVGQWEGFIQNVIGFSYREGCHDREVTLTSGEEDPVNPETIPDGDAAAPPASVISGHWEDSEGNEVYSVSALNGDSVYYYSLGYNADYVVITHIEIDPNDPLEFPQNIPGTHLRWVFDDVGLYDVYAMYLLYQHDDTAVVPEDREGQYLGQISKDDENIIYAYVGEYQPEQQS